MYASGMVLQNPELREDPEATMTYLGTLLVQQAKHQQPSSRNISKVSTGDKADSTREVAAFEQKPAGSKKRSNGGGSGKGKSNKKQSANNVVHERDLQS